MDKLREWIVPILETKGCHLYDIEWLSSERPPLLRISVEKDDGSMDLDTCAICSDAISEILDQKDWFASEYMLEVCSPGAERELKNEEQLQNAIDQYVFWVRKSLSNGTIHLPLYLPRVVKHLLPPPRKRHNAERSAWQTVVFADKDNKNI